MPILTNMLVIFDRPRVEERAILLTTPAALASIWFGAVHTIARLYWTKLVAIRLDPGADRIATIAADRAVQASNTVSEFAVSVAQALTSLKDRVDKLCNETLPEESDEADEDSNASIDESTASDIADGDGLGIAQASQESGTHDSDHLPYARSEALRLSLEGCQDFVKSLDQDLLTTQNKQKARRDKAEREAVLETEEPADWQNMPISP